ncbi:DUF3558 domain-containing protein [Nocardia flavorosea]|uniref:DUF3558 domain-containing protein n=1 Tax=Nocardia flavorosea TaxID=53429 RepID=UPI0018938AD1|nr:DUF3558 domain-containing protein [Nocardia flavorosea]MBF6351510.1 DUF3558 domain-containing protein [Nocardia flavorosea]
MRTAKNQRRGGVRNVMVAVAVAGLAAGCGGAVDGEPAAGGTGTTTGEQHVEWNPCSELSADALQATGADPATRSSVFDAPGNKSAWRMCTWQANDGPYFIGVGATVFTQDDVYENKQVTGIEPVQINDRSGLTYHLVGNEDPIRLCYVSLPMQKGMLNVYASWQYSERDSIPESPPCGLAVQHARTLEPYLPD